MQRARQCESNSSRGGLDLPEFLEPVLRYKGGRRVHRITDELASLRSHRILTSWFSCVSKFPSNRMPEVEINYKELVWLEQERRIMHENYGGSFSQQWR